MAEPTPALPRPWVRRAVALVLAWHGLCAVGDVLSAAGAPGADAARTVTAPYRDLVGFRQWWSMFSPNPPSNSRGLELSVMRADARWETLVSPALARPGDVVAVYRRMGKFERNLIKEKDAAARARDRVADTLCEQGAGGAPVVGVRIVRVERETPPPGGAPGDWERTEQLTRWCR